MDEEEVASMDRPALLQLVVRGMTARAEGERTASVTARSSPRETTQSRELEVQLELRRAELELRKAELDAENKKAEREVQLRMRQMEMEEKRKR